MVIRHFFDPHVIIIFEMIAPSLVRYILDLKISNFCLLFVWFISIVIQCRLHAKWRQWFQINSDLVLNISHSAANNLNDYGLMTVISQVGNTLRPQQGSRLLDANVSGRLRSARRCDYERSDLPWIRKLLLLGRKEPWASCWCKGSVSLPARNSPMGQCRK